MCDATVAPLVEAATVEMRRSVAALERHIDGGGDATYVRSAALLDRVDRALVRRSGTHLSDGTLAVRDLMLIDSALAVLAGAYGMRLADHDVAGIRPA